MSYKIASTREHSEKDQKWASYISLAVGIVLLALKFWAFDLTGSQAIFSDAMESIVNVVAAIMVIFVVFYANLPADKEHPYGHGKIEHFSAAFEGGLISFAALIIIIDSTLALIKGHQLEQLNIGLFIVAVAGIVNFALGYFLVSVGKKRSSRALVASGHHVISDFWTSFGIIIGLVLVKITGYYWLDSLCAIVVSLFLAKTGIGIIRSSVAGLLDEKSPEALELVAKIFSKHNSKSIIQVHHMKMIRSGQYHHIDAHLVVPEYWDVKAVHKNIDRFEQSIMKDYPFNLELHFHLDPCRRAYCQVCDVTNCPIRREDFVAKLPMDVAQLTSPEEPDKFRDASDH